MGKDLNEKLKTLDPKYTTIKKVDNMKLTEFIGKFTDRLEQLEKARER